MIVRIAWLLLLLTGLLPPLPLSPGADGEGCPDCRYTGIVPCTSHREVSEEPSEDVPLVFCSWATSCSMCGGVLWHDCGRCAGGPRSEWMQERLREMSDWAQENDLERTLERSVGRLETERFALVVDADGLKDGSKRVSPHALAHQLAADVEHVAALIARQYGAEAKDYTTKMRMWLWGDKAAHEKTMAAFLGTIAGGDFKALGQQPTFTVWPERPFFDTVPKVRAVFVHNASHLLLTNAFGTSWVGDIGGGWLDAGAGHWYEYERFGITLNACIEEATSLDAWEGGLWRAAMRRRLEKDKDPLLPNAFAKRTGAMSSAEQAVCWSFYDYLVAEHPTALKPMLVALKQRAKPPREILAEHTGLELRAAEVSWRSWVRTAYPKRETPPR